MIRFSTLVHNAADVEPPVLRPETAPEPAQPDFAGVLSSALVETWKSSNENAAALSAAIVDIGRANSENTMLLKAAISQVTATEERPITGMDIVHETDPKSIRYGMIRRVIFTRD